MKFEDILSSIDNQVYYPMYFLSGEEPFYIDRVSDYIENNILEDEEKELNQSVIYGKDTNVKHIIEEAKQFPFGSKYRIVIIKEAQNIRNIDDLGTYLKQPQPSTILVICYKYKRLDKRKKFTKDLTNKGLLFESNKLYENQIPNWIINYLSNKKYKINQKACHMLTNHVGNNLTNITNELEKLMLVVKQEDEITSELIEQNIGISKDFNVFELQEALANKHVVKSNKIVNHFASDSRSHPLIVTLGMLFSFFQKIITYQSLKDKTSSNVTRVLKINPYFIPQYKKAAKNYSQKKIVSIFSEIKKYDLRAKGVNNNNTNDGELLKELVYKILH